VRRLPRVRPDVLATRRHRADAEAEGQARQDQAATPSRYLRSCVLLHVVAVDDELPAAPPGYGPVDGHWPADHRLV